MLTDQLRSDECSRCSRSNSRLSFALLQCLQYKTDQAQDVKKIEKLHGKLMRLMVSKESHSGAMETDWADLILADVQASFAHVTWPNVLIYFSVLISSFDGIFRKTEMSFAGMLLSSGLLMEDQLWWSHLSVVRIHICYLIKMESATSVLHCCAHTHVSIRHNQLVVVSAGWMWLRQEKIWSEWEEVMKRRRRDGQPRRSDGQPPGWKDFLQQCPNVGGARPDSYEWLWDSGEDEEGGEEDDTCPRWSGGSSDEGTEGQLTNSSGDQGDMLETTWWGRKGDWGGGGWGGVFREKASLRRSRTLRG